MAEKQYRDCEQCDGVMELMSFTPREAVGYKKQNGHAGSVYKKAGETRFWWQCLNSFSHKADDEEVVADALVVLDEDCGNGIELHDILVERRLEANTPDL